MEEKTTPIPDPNDRSILEDLQEALSGNRAQRRAFLAEMRRKAKRLKKNG
ncbi:hypothetical protein RPALISO_129 [Ruegeria phage RpAliso]|nr:hypothetical protein RPALISO_129 [Ruegeria phage RpAliso]